MTDQERLKMLERILSSMNSTLWESERTALQITIDILRYKLNPTGWPAGEKGDP